MGPAMLIVIGFAFLTGGLYWHYVNTRTIQVSTLQAAKPEHPIEHAGPTLEAVDDGKIDATGGKFVGDLKFPFCQSIARWLYQYAGN